MCATRGKTAPGPRGQPPPGEEGGDGMTVTFWGTRGSIATPGPDTERYGGNTSCVSVRAGDIDIVLDAGTGIRNLGLAMARRANGPDRPLDVHILLSHTHWDHIQGLPFFEPAYRDGVNMSIYGSPKKGRFLESILRGQMDIDYFPVGMSSLSAQVSITELTRNPARIGPVRVDWEEQVFHPGGSVRYRLCAGGRRLVYSTDVELDGMFSGREGGDSRRLAGLYEEFIRGADLLIADGQYTAGEYAERAGRGHSSIPLLLEVAHRCGVKQLVVFHHEPLHTDAVLDALQAEHRPRCARATPPMTVLWAREGMTLAV